MEAAVLVGLVLAVLAWTRRDARVFVVLAAAQVGVLLMSPSYFEHYAAFSAPALALVLAAGLGVAAGAGRWPRAAVAAVVAVALAGSADADRRLDVGTVLPGAALRPAAAGVHCVTADSAALLVALDVLSRELSRGCPVAVDLTGLTYDRDALPLRPDGSAVPRPENPRWQRSLMAHLTAGEATILGRRGADGFSPANARVVARWPVLAERDGWILHAPRRSPPQGG